MKTHFVINKPNSIFIKFFIVSAHREENVDAPENFHDMIETLNALAEKYNYPVIVSTHPRTRKSLEELNLTNLNKNIQFSKPFGFCDYTIGNFFITYSS